MYYKILLILIIISGCQSTTQDIFPTKTPINPKQKKILSTQSKRILKPKFIQPVQLQLALESDTNQIQTNKFKSDTDQEYKSGTNQVESDTNQTNDSKFKSDINQVESDTDQEYKSGTNQVESDTNRNTNQTNDSKFKSDTNQEYKSGTNQVESDTDQTTDSKFKSDINQVKSDTNQKDKEDKSDINQEDNSDINQEDKSGTNQVESDTDQEDKSGTNQVESDKFKSDKFKSDTNQNTNSESIERAQKVLTKEEIIQKELHALIGSYEYVVYVEDKLSGWQNMVVQVRDDGAVVMNSSIEFSFTALWIFTITYKHTCEEIWQNGSLQSIKTNTVKNGTKINLDLQRVDNKLIGTLDQNNISIDAPISTNNAWNLFISFSHHSKYGVVNPEDGVLTYLDLLKVKNQYMRIQNESILCSHLKAQGRDWEFWFHPKGFLTKQKDFLEGYKVEIILKKYY